MGVSSAAAQAPPERDRPTVYVVPFQRAGDYVSEMALGKIETYYRTLLSMNSDLEPITAAVQVQTEPAPSAAPAALQQDKVLDAADKALWQGKDFLQDKNWRAAIRALTAAIKGYEKKIALLEDLDKLIEAQLLLALTRFAQGYEDDGEEALARVMVLRPDLAVDRRWRSPAVDKAFERLKDGLFRVPTGTLEVSCPVKECRVYVDGVLRGSHGARVDGLPRGHHYVRVVAAGYEPWAAKVFTPAKGATRAIEAKSKVDRSQPAVAAPTAAPVTPGAQVSPELLAAFVREGRYGADFLVQAGQFCKQSGADHVVMGFVNRVGEQYVVAAYVYTAARQQVVEAGKTLVQLDISDLQVKLLEVEQQVSKAIADFPDQRVVTESPPRVYARWEPPAQPAPVVVAAPTPAVAPPAPVVQPQPAPVAQPQPAAVTQPPPAPVAQPQPAAVTQPPPAPVAQPQPAPVTQPPPAPVAQPQPVQPQPVYGPNQPGYPQPVPAQPTYTQPAQPAQPVYQPQPTYGQQQPTYQPPVYPVVQPQPVQPQPVQPQQPVYAQPQPPAQPPVAAPPSAAGQQVAQADPAPTEMRRPSVRHSTPFTVAPRAPAAAGVVPTQPQQPIVVDEPIDEPGDDDAVYKKWWFWTAIIGGAAAVSAAIAVPVLLNGSAPPASGANATVTWE